MSSSNQQNMVVPVWQTRAAIALTAVIAVLLGVSILAQGHKAFASPAYAVMAHTAAFYVWGLAFAIPGAVALGLTYTPHRSKAKGWLLWLGGLELFVGLSILPFVITHGPTGILGVVLYLALSAQAFLAALKATLLP
jgi:uncharacterized membrane protein HdeD (DUF308 family)